MGRTHYGLCNFCDAVCGLEIEVEGREVLSIRGDVRDPFSRGHICPKAVAQQDLYEDKDRVRAPLRRRGNDWEEISWSEALEEAGERMAAVQKEHGDDALAFYFGNPISHNYGSMLHLIPFARGLGTKNVYSSGSVDAFSRMLVSQLVFGSPAILPIPDLDRTSYLLILGANPAISNGSIMTAPDCRRRLGELRQRGGRIVVIDPRRTETAELADEHHFIEPATDALFLLSLLQVFHAEGLVRPVQGFPVRGLAELPDLVRPFTPEAVAPRVGISADNIRKIARDFAAAPGAACYGRMGTSVQSFSTLATWAVDMVNLVTGNVDRVGGVMFTTPAVDLVGLANALGQAGSFGSYKSRVTGLRELNGELPVAALLPELETKGPGQIKGLVTLSGNVVLSIPDGARVERALSGLDYMVSIDVYVNETTRHANLVLPPVSPLESDHYPLLEHAMAIRNTAHYTEALFEKEESARHDWEIMSGLAESFGRHRGGRRRLTGLVHGVIGRHVAPRRVLDLLLRVGPHRLSLEKLRAQPHGLDLGPLEPRLAKLISTPSKQVEVLPKEIRDDLPRLVEALSAPPRRAGAFALISQRTLRSMNSWLHNTQRLVSGKPRCLVTMHPTDATRLGLRAGEDVTLTSTVGRVTVGLRVSDEIKPGVLAMPYGWGHARKGSRLSVASKQKGPSYNDLVDASGHDPVSGASVLNGVDVTVERAEQS